MLVEEAVEKYLKDTAKLLQDTIKAQGFNVSGKTAAGVGYSRNGIKGEVTAPPSIQFIINGRRPGAMPPIAVIEGWIKKRGLQLNAWAVAKKMATSGSAIWRGERAPLDITSVRETYKEELLENLAAAYAEQILRKIKPQ